VEQDDTPPEKERAAAAACAFDIWLRRSLHRLYDDAAREPVPPELLRLIEEDRLRRRS
jgi:hypothetical protein